MNELTPRAQVADAINTIVRRDDGLVGDNTDGAGLLADLTTNLGLEWSAARGSWCSARAARRAAPSGRCSSSSRACS